jgi:hypothetical protein
MSKGWIRDAELYSCLAAGEVTHYHLIYEIVLKFVKLLYSCLPSSPSQSISRTINRLG